MVRCRPPIGSNGPTASSTAFVPTVPFRYLPPKQSVRMAFNVILDREPDPVGGPDYTQNWRTAN